MKATRLFTLLALLLMAGGTVNAQQWEIDYGNATSYTIMKSGIVNSNGENVLVGVSGPDKNHYYPAIMSVTVDGECNSRVFDTIEGNVGFTHIVQLHNGNYFAAAIVQADVFGIGEDVIFMILDSDFNIINVKSYEKPEFALTMGEGRLMLDDDGTIVASGGFQYQDVYGVRRKPYFYRFDENADTLSCRFVQATSPQPEATITGFECHQIMQNPTDEGFIVLCDGGINGNCSLLRYDYDFNYVNGFQMIPVAHELFNNAFSDHWLSDGKLLVMGTVWPYGNYDNWTVGMAEVSLDGIFEHWDRVYHVQDTSVQAPNQCMAYVNDTTIYGGSWYYKQPAGGENHPSISLYDTDFKVLGRKEFDEPEYISSCNFVLPMSDGSCLIGTVHGTYYLGDYSYGKLIKMRREDFNPIPYSVKEVPQEVIKALVYPNPASEVVRIEGIEAAKVQVYNALGQLVKTVRNSNEISVKGLPEGVYLLRIMDAEGKSHAARVVVKE